MASTNHSVGIEVKVSTSGEEKLGSVARGVDGIAQGAAAAAPQLKPVAEGVQAIGRDAGVDEQARKIGQLGDEAKKASQGMDLLGAGVGKLPALLGPIAGLVAGAFALDSLAGFAAGLAPIADAAKNLEARMRLAVGETGDLEGALEAVRSSANETGSDINAVGDLFGSLARSTAELGTSQADVATLTDTISKSFAVSGTSAQAASGAITQLSQAFAAGALRGDEFNSVNEAAPRLMQALADGLGVARGELRAMAEQGALTTEVVMGALQGQAAAIEAEFATLPDTVGRATQRLANEWQVFIGRLDETSGATDAVASGLTLVAENLDAIAGVAATAGEVVVTALAVKAAAALRGYVTLATASTAATAAQAAALNGLAAAGKAATAAMLTLGRALPALAVAGAVAGVAALVVEFFRAKSAAEDADAAIEAMLAEPPQNAVAGEIELVATKAEALRFKLSEVELKFQELRARGQDAAQALGTVVKAADISSSGGIEKLINDLEVLRKGAQVTGEQIDTALRQRLAQLSARELQEFRMQAEMAFKGSADAAQRLAQINDAVLAASFAKLGVSAAAALGQISPAAQEAIDGIDGIVVALEAAEVESVRAANAIELALGAAFKKADTLAAIDALNEKMKGLGESGKLGADAMTRLADASDAARRRIEDMTPGIQSVEEAFRRLGVTSQREMERTAAQARQAFQMIRDSGTATAQELQAAFRVYAEAAVAANEGVVDSAVKAEAAALGLKVAADESGKVIVQSMREAAAETLKVKEAADATKEGLEGAAEGAEQVAESSREAASSAEAASSGAIQVRASWLDASAAASRYASEAIKIANITYESALNSTRHFGASTAAIDNARLAAAGYVSALESLDARQDALNSSGAAGLDALRLRWIELNGTEEEVAKARFERDRGQIERSVASLQLDLRRAEIRGQMSEANKLREEIALYKEQIVLLERIYREEERQRVARERSGGNTGGDARPRNTTGGISTGAPAMPAPGLSGSTVNINLPATPTGYDRATLDSLARQLGPVITDLQRKGAL